MCSSCGHANMTSNVARLPDGSRERERGTMVTFAGVGHVAFTVTDLDASERFYTDVLDFRLVMDVGYARIFMHPGTGFTLALAKYPGAPGGTFSELNTGLDHLGF